MVAVHELRNVHGRGVLEEPGFLIHLASIAALLDSCASKMLEMSASLITDEGGVNITSGPWTVVMLQIDLRVC